LVIDTISDKESEPSRMLEWSKKNADVRREFTCIRRGVNVRTMQVGQTGKNTTKEFPDG